MGHARFRVRTNQIKSNQTKNNCIDIMHYLLMLVTDSKAVLAADWQSAEWRS
jgi:hypothetical protein